MTTSIGPIVGTSDINAGLSFATTGGAFVLTSAGDTTFTATTTTIPEPSTWAMMALGFAGLGFLGYRKTRSGNALA
jgi:PEP-CTERM motif